MFGNWSFRNRVGSAVPAASIIVLVLGSMALASGPETSAPPEPPQDTYPLDMCIVSGAPLGSMGAPVVREYDGREIRFCCRGCVKAFEKNPTTYLNKMDAAIIKVERPGYPLQTCVVSGDTLGVAGAPVDYVYHNHLVRFCSAACVTKFEKNPDLYLMETSPAEPAEVENEAGE
jgi:YHS domain-containing protein